MLSYPITVYGRLHLAVRIFNSHTLCIPKREKIHLFSNHSAVKQEKILFINSITQTRSGMAISFIDNCWYRRYGPRSYGPRDTEREDRKTIIVVSSRLLTAKQLNCLDITIFCSSEGHLLWRLNNPSLTPVLATEIGRTDLNLWRPNNPSGEQGIQNNLLRTGKRYYSSFLSVITPDLQ